MERRTRELTEAQRVAHIGSWEWEIPENKVSWSDELYRIFGLSPKSFPGSYEAYLRYIHPHDRAMADKIIAQALENHKPFDFYYRVLMPDGTERIIHGAGSVTVDENGNAVRMNGTAQDVTEIKQAEKALIAQKEEVEKLNRFMIDREAKMIELKKEIERLKK